jgi:8-oxo-dGTP pyrophosphatase MutT (NUDIX family)
MQRRITSVLRERRDALIHPTHGDFRIQVAALCWRRLPLPEVLLVTTLRTRRWILPKGWPQEEQSLSQSAAIEAHEEAGVRGEIWPTPLGEYHYLKEKGGIGYPCRVQVFPLLVTRTDLNFAEKGQRQLAWLPFEEAARRLAEPDLRRLVRGFRRLRLAA